MVNQKERDEVYLLDFKIINLLIIKYIKLNINKQINK